MIFPKLLMPEKNGVNANPLRKLEIKPIVEVVGLLPLLKYFLIDGVLPVDKLNKPE